MSGRCGGRIAMTEATFLSDYDPSAFPAVAVTVDVALFTLVGGALAVLLVERGGHPFRGAWALPGGFVRPDETLSQAASRELEEETGVATFEGHLAQLATYGDPGRDPRMRIVSVAHVAIAAELPPARAGSDAAQARYWKVEELGLDRRRKHAPKLAFDHERILRDALERVRGKLEYTTLAIEFLEQPFTIAALRRVYEAVWGVELDPGNFQRKVLGTDGFLEATDDFASPGSGGGRKARLFRAGRATALHPPVLRSRA